MASPINNGTTISNSCSHSILDKEINIADELHIKNYAKKYSPGSNFAKWMLQEIKRLIVNIMSGSRNVSTDILDYFHPMPGTENNGNRTWMAATGESEYTVIEQTGDKSFKIIQKDENSNERTEISYSGVAVASIIKSLSEKTAALETHSADTLLRKSIVNCIVMKNKGAKKVINADIENNIYNLLKLQIQKDEGYLPVHESFNSADVFLESIIMDAHRTIKEQSQQNGAAKITCCGVELSKDILEIFANKIKIIENETKNSQSTLQQIVPLVCFKDDESSQLSKLLKQSKSNITDDKIDEIIDCLSSPQGISCFYHACIQSYQSYLKGITPDVLQGVNKSMEKLSSGKSGYTLVGGGKYVNEIYFTKKDFRQKLYVAGVSNDGDEVKLECSRYFTKGVIKEESTDNSFSFTFSGAATIADL